MRKFLAALCAVLSLALAAGCELDAAAQTSESSGIQELQAAGFKQTSHGSDTDGNQLAEWVLGDRLVGTVDGEARLLILTVPALNAKLGCKPKPATIDYFEKMQKMVADHPDWKNLQPGTQHEVTDVCILDIAPKEDAK